MQARGLHQHDAPRRAFARQPEHEVRIHAVAPPALQAELGFRDVAVPPVQRRALVEVAREADLELVHVRGAQRGLEQAPADQLPVLAQQCLRRAA